MASAKSLDRIPFQFEHAGCGLSQIQSIRRPRRIERLTDESIKQNSPSGRVEPPIVA
jgi:hypothetical protein